MRHYILTALTALLFAGCNEEKIALYDGAQSYIYFTTDYTKIVRFSFISIPDKNETLIGIPVEIVGGVPNESLSYKVVVDTEKTTASSSNYEVPTAPIFSKGVVQDTLYIKVINSADLATQEKDIVITIIDSENYLAGPSVNRTKTIRISDIMAKPDWWDKDFEDAFLGEYSDKKYEEFIKATGVADITGKDNNEITGLCRSFVYYLRKLKDEGKEVIEDDGTPMLETINIKA